VEEDTLAGITDDIADDSRSIYPGVGGEWVKEILGGFLFHIDPSGPAIPHRTNVGLGDILLALRARIR